MTYADEEFIPSEGQEENPKYPTAFGITFTPTVCGIIVGALGLVAAGYLLLNVVQPSWEENQKIQTEIKTTKDQIAASGEIQKQIKQKQVQLEQVKLENKQVLNLFGTQRSLDTLLLDLNSFVKSRNGTMLRFEPQKEIAARTNNKNAAPLPGEGKLERKIYNVEFEGSFDQVQSILRSFERLQSLLLVKDFTAKVSDDQGVVVNVTNGKSVPAVFKREKNQVIPGGKPTITTTFKLEALYPATEEEAAAQPAKKTKK